MTTAYLAAEGFEPQLREELQRAGVEVRPHERLLIGDKEVAAAWAANIWHDCVELPVTSIGAAAKALRDIQRNWAMYAPLHHRRAALIQERLPHVSAKPIVFPAAAPTAPLGSWTLLAPDRLLMAARCSSPFPNGEVDLRRGQDRPAQPGLSETLGGAGAAADAGRSRASAASISAPRRAAGPGCWPSSAPTSWPSTRRRSIPTVAAMPGVEWRGESAFALEPESVGPVDWLFTDIVCYPARLLRLVERWRASGLVTRFVCTIKFQGETDHESTAAFAALPNARVLHLHHNKHELTLFVLASVGEPGGPSC